VHKHLRVALLIETTSTWGSRLVEGIASYANMVGGWQFYLEPHGKFESLSIPREWTGDGLIGRITSQALADQILDRKLPAVNVSWYQFGRGFIPACTSDMQATANLCAKHLIDQGLPAIGYCANWRRQGFQDLFAPKIANCAKQSDIAFYAFDPNDRLISGMNWHDQLTELGRWLKGLPRPIGIVTIDHVVARQVLEACRLNAISVPEEVAVLSVEFDQLASDISLPHLSGVDGAPRKVGYEAAAMLIRLVKGESRPDEDQLLPPAGIISRQSSEHLGLADPIVAAALKYIRENTHRPLRVNDIVSQLAISRRTLEQRFIQSLGRSPATEIRRLRLERAKRLLVDTNVPLATVAMNSGFEAVSVMTRLFRREVKMSPSEYREKGQL